MMPTKRDEPTNHERDPDQENDLRPGAGGSVDEAVVAAFESELAEARRRADENWDRYLRAEADLENARRRNAKLREDAVAAARRELLARILEVADNLERALAFADSDPKALVEGVEGTYRELSRLLDREGVKMIPAMDAPFDPTVHEAVSVVPWPDADEEIVVSVDRAGYTLNGDLLRPARVVVGQPVSNDEGGEAQDG